MAIQLRVASVEYMIEEDDGEGGTVDRDLSAEGRLQVHIQYFDSADPETVLYEEDFILGAKPFTAADALEAFRAKGRKVRDTRVLKNELAAFIGNVYDLT